MILAHGVGRVYESPIPLYLYLLGAAATVGASFAIRSLQASVRSLPAPRRLLGPRPAGAIRTILKVAAVLMLALTIVSGAVVRETGTTFTTFAFWVGLIVGTTLLAALVKGVWDAADPFQTIEGVYRIEDAEVTVRRAPWWVGPLSVYALFWFELVSGVGFDSFWVVTVLVGYALVAFTFRAALGTGWAEADPLAILFGFAGRTAPFALRSEGFDYVGPMRGLEEGRAMPRALYVSVFVLLAATTFDNLAETVGWSDFIRATNLDALPDLLVDSVALAVMALPFYLSFLLVMYVARGSLRLELSLDQLARSFGWTLVPIGIAYVLAHNTPLLMTGLPQLVGLAADPFEQGWNLLGARGALDAYSPSPQLVWFLEIAIIVGGHVLGVLAAHRTALRLAPRETLAVRSQYALTGLMSVYTITTLWLLAQPLVS